MNYKELFHLSLQCFLFECQIYKNSFINTVWTTTQSTKKNKMHSSLFVCCLFVVSAVRFAPYLTGLSSMMLKWAAGVGCKWRVHLHNRMPWQTWTTDILVLGQALCHWATLYITGNVDLMVWIVSKQQQADILIKIIVRVTLTSKR